MTHRIVVVGPPGAGKTTIATQLAQRLGLTMRDTDADIEAETGSTIADLFVERGEQEFRQLEESAVRRAVDELCASESGGVLALGGGAVLSADTRSILKNQLVEVVFLDVGLTQAVKRVGLGAGRPLLLGNVRSTLKRLLDERAPLYREVADIVVTTDELGQDDVAEQVLKQLNGGLA